MKTMAVSLCSSSSSGLMSSLPTRTGGAAGIQGFAADHGADVFQNISRYGNTSPMRPDYAFLF